ncbi:hypothetical protein, partial [Hungatella hathewayi]|uniref:hypothetical protein n=2 Tax=Hungatella TaxID=1649459 RepID=UPI0032190DF5
KDTMILKNGTIIELEAGASLGALQVVATDRAAMVATWEVLTPDNLAAVQIKNGDGIVIGNYTDLVLASETSTVSADGAVLTTYSLREKTDIEKRLDAVEEGQAVQDGAIGDLGEAVGTLAEGGIA